MPSARMRRKTPPPVSEEFEVSVATGAAVDGPAVIWA